MAMAFQLMNSLLYMIEYGLQCYDVHSPNYYNISGYELGVLMIGRPFMYVNIFWLIMPTYIIFYEISNISLNKYSRTNSEKIELAEEDNLVNTHLLNNVENKKD